MSALLLAAACAAACAADVPCAAQAVSLTLPIDATVVNGTMTIATLQNLDFGQVTGGVPASLAPNAAGAGAWQVTGSPNAFVSVSFSLPSLLTNIQAQPGSTMPISFPATSARYRRQVNNPNGGATTFDPNAGTVARFGPNPNPTLFIWIGGQVNPAVATKPGIYTGTVVVSLAYP